MSCAAAMRDGEGEGVRAGGREREAEKAGREPSLFTLPYTHSYGCFVRMYVCTYERMYVCTYIYVNMCVCMYVCKYGCVYVCVYERTYAQTFIHTNVQATICIDVCMYVCTCFCLSGLFCKGAPPK